MKVGCNIKAHLSRLLEAVLKVLLSVAIRVVFSVLGAIIGFGVMYSLLNAIFPAAMNLRQDIINRPLPPVAADATTASVPDWQWVEPERDWVKTLLFAEQIDQCGIQFGGTLIERNRADDTVHVEYRLPAGEERHPGTPCDGGERFALPASQFDAMSARYHAIVSSEAARTEAVRSVLQNPTPAPATALVDDWRWVDVLNPGTPRGEKCGIMEGGELAEIGRAGDRVLVEYTSPTYKTMGTPCDGGEIFFVPASLMGTAV